MSAPCSNCYSGCSEIVPDKCVKYTGIGMPVLGIQNGDSINYVTSALIGFVKTLIDGSGIKYTLDEDSLCTIVSTHLSDCTDITVVDITNALSAAICGLDDRIVVVEDWIKVADGNFDVSCLDGVNAGDGIRLITEAIITKLCTVVTDLDALELNVETNYVHISDINTYIANYLTNNYSSGVQPKDKMVPYTVVEYYGPLNVFDATGAGIDDWEDVYLCNGNNGTPDKRGRIAVGTTTGMGGGSFPSATDPTVTGNPNYSLYTTTGSNVVVLTTAQIPSHTHTATMSEEGDHNHADQMRRGTMIGDFNNPAGGGAPNDDTLQILGNTASTNAVLTGAHKHDITVNPIGGGESHNNIPPVLACHYIMYIPS